MKNKNNGCVMNWAALRTIVSHKQHSEKFDDRSVGGIRACGAHVLSRKVK